MDNRMLKRLCLTIVCVSLIATMFAVKPIASYPAGQRGPRVDLLRQKVTRSPAAQLIEMQNGPPTGSDLAQGQIRPTDIEDLTARNKLVSSRGGNHFCMVGMNYRRPPLGDVNYRHALAHLVPKDRIIGSLFRYVVVRVDTQVPPAMALWFNGGVDPHPYSPAEAEAILGHPNSNYAKVDGVWRYKAGGALQTLRFFTPLEVSAPTSFTIGRMVVEEAQKIGLMNVEQVPMDFATYLDLVFNKWDFELFWVCYSFTTPWPIHLWDMFNSENNFLGSSNPFGINSPEIDAATDILYFSLDRDAQIAATLQTQELLTGGSSLSPMPENVPAGDYRDQALPVFTVYSRNYYDIQQPQMRGAVNMYGYGTDNDWTYMNFYWGTGADEYRPGTTERTIVRVESEFPERLNPLFATTVYANDFMSRTLDGLLHRNPYTHRDEAWLSTRWEYEVTPGGMDVTFDVRLTDLHGTPVMWQDNDPISLDDIRFSWDFFAGEQIPNYWSAFKYYGSADIVDADTITAHMTQASVWHVYTLAGSALYLPPQVWSQAVRNWPTDETRQQTILGWDPSAVAYPDPDGAGPLRALPTSLWGTGAFINIHSTTTIGTQAYGDLQANRNYWLTTADIGQKIADMFHSAGDVNYDAIIDGADISAIGGAYLTVPGDPLWNSLADVTGPAGKPPDSVVDIFDLATAGKFFGEPRTVVP